MKNHDSKDSRAVCGTPCDGYTGAACENCGKVLYACCEEVVRDDDNIPCCRPCAEKCFRENSRADRRRGACICPCHDTPRGPCRCSCSSRETPWQDVRMLMRDYVYAVLEENQQSTILSEELRDAFKSALATLRKGTRKVQLADKEITR